MRKNLVLAAVIFALNFSNCAGCFKNGSKRDAEVYDCRVHNKHEDDCNAATAGKVRCQYEKATGTCKKSPERKEIACDKLPMKECKASKFCTYLDATRTCGDADPALTGKCDVIQEKIPCMADTTCEWNDTGLVCQSKKQ